MLVVSRKQNQSVVFPSLGIRVEILRIAGKTIRVGVEAPDSVQILRGELSGMPCSDGDHSGTGESASKEAHELRNRLNKANLAMKLLQKQLAAGSVEGAEKSLAIALQTFEQMEQSASVRGVRRSTACFQSNVSNEVTPRKRALLVEDDPNERMLLAGYLRASGYDVDTVEDGQAALEYLSEFKPDAVVMDMEMPRLSGSECIQEIRRDYQFDDMKLFVVSGMEQKAMKVPMGDRGVQRWFQKPLCPEDLVKELEASLN